MDREDALLDRDDRRMEALLYSPHLEDQEPEVETFGQDDENNEPAEAESMDNLTIGDIAGDVNLVLPQSAKQAEKAESSPATAETVSGFRKAVRWLIPLATLALGGGAGASVVPLLKMLASPREPTTATAPQDVNLGDEDGEPPRANSFGVLGIDK